MELAELIAGLSGAAAYPFAVEAVEIRQTHISVVFLAGQFAYKIKKPVQFGFLDFSTLEQRRHFCQEEVRLNRRLAAEVYLDVVPVARTPTGVQVEGAGEPVEWAVKMERLADAANLENHLLEGKVSVETIEALARRIAAFHAQAERSGRIAGFGRFDVVARNAHENLEQIAPHVGTTISRACFDRLRTLIEESLDQYRPLIESRAQRGVPCDTHGDLRLEHVYLFPNRAPPADLVVIDCIEFNERFRFADPVADMAFLTMDFTFHGRDDLARKFANEYFRSGGDEEGRNLLPFYTSYRAAVRGKVESLKLGEKEIPQCDQSAALVKARGYWLLALCQLEVPERKPCMVLVAGLPGSGKSTLAADLAERAGFSVVRSDVVRKELAGGLVEDQGPRKFGTGIYSPDWNERTYAECLRRARSLLFEGKRVIVDASFRQNRERENFLTAAVRCGVPALFLLCQADEDVIRRRLAARRGDASDADWSIYRGAAATWDEPGPLAQSVCQAINTEGSRETTVERALEILSDHRLSTKSALPATD
jgi:hypothetical protein